MGPIGPLPLWCPMTPTPSPVRLSAGAASSPTG